MADPARSPADMVVDLAGRLSAKRATWEWHWDLIHKYIFPAATPPNPNRKPVPGDRAHFAVLDNVAEMANEMLAAAVTDALTPEDIDWFSLRVTDDDRLNDDDEVGRWLEACSAIMLNVFRSPRAGYGVASHEMRTDLVTFGTGCMAVMDKLDRGIVFLAVPLSQILLVADSEGRVAGTIRRFEMPAWEAAEEFGDAVGEAVLRMAESKSSQDRERCFPFIDAVLPRGLRDPSRAATDSRHKVFANFVVQARDRVLIRESGFDLNPYVTPRWTKRAGEDYGRSPAMKVLGTVQMLQRTARVNIAAAEQVLSPPMMVSDDGVVGPVNLKNAAINTVRADIMDRNTAPIRPILTGGRPDIGEDLMRGMREQIENGYFKPLIQLVRKDRMTATEVLEVMEQNQKILSPFMGRLKMEDVGPTVERVFQIMLNADAFPPMPQKLAGREVGVEYVSPMVRRQRISQARGLAQFLEITAPLSNVDGSVHDNLDVDRAYRDTADIMGLYKDWLRPSNKVGDMRQARQQVQQEAAERQAAMETAQTMAQAAGAARDAGILPASGGGIDTRQTLLSPSEAFGDVA